MYRRINREKWIERKQAEIFNELAQDTDAVLEALEESWQGIDIGTLFLEGNWDEIGEALDDPMTQYLDEKASEMAYSAFTEYLVEYAEYEHDRRREEGL